jgi:hypothetical protein
MASEQDKLRTLLQDADNDLNHSTALAVLRAVRGNVDEARAILIPSNNSPSTAQHQHHHTAQESAMNFLQSVDLSNLTPEERAAQAREYARIQQELADQEFARRLGSNPDQSIAGLAPSEQPEQQQQQQQREAEAEAARLRALEIERQRQQQQQLEAERRRQQQQQLEQERQRYLQQQIAEAEAERQRALQLEQQRLQQQQQELERLRHAQEEELERQRVLRAEAEAERQRVLEAERKHQEQEQLQREAEQQRQAELQRQAVEEAEERRRQAEAEQRRQAEERQRIDQEAEQRRQQAEAEQRRQQEQLQQQEQAAVDAATEEAEARDPNALIDDAALLEQFTANQAKLRQDQERAAALAERTAQLGRLHESTIVEIKKLQQPQAASVATAGDSSDALLKMQRDLEQLNEQLKNARQAQEAAEREADQERARVEAELKAIRIRASRPPKVSIFILSNNAATTSTTASAAASSITASIDEQVTEIRQLLRDNGVQDQEATVIDVANDREQACFIQQKLGREVAYPVISILGQPIGVCLPNCNLYSRSLIQLTNSSLSLSLSLSLSVSLSVCRSIL